jgi:hypothetical protein
MSPGSGVYMCVWQCGGQLGSLCALGVLIVAAACVTLWLRCVASLHCPGLLIAQQLPRARWRWAKTYGQAPRPCAAHRPTPVLCSRSARALGSRAPVAWNYIMRACPLSLSVVQVSLSARCYVGCFVRSGRSGALRGLWSLLVRLGRVPCVLGSRQNTTCGYSQNKRDSI